MLVVIDTNILVSSLMSPFGAPAKLMGLVIQGSVTPCFDYRIMIEYREVLSRPKFGFTNDEINALLGGIQINGMSVLAEPLDIPFTDESDKKFYEVAKFCRATLITGNIRHFPKDSRVTDVRSFLGRFRIL